MFIKATKHIENNFPFLRGKKLLIACSGGLDSMVLLHLMHREGYSVFVAHCNFSLRGNESDDDETFVLDYCKKATIKAFSKTFDTKLFAKTNKLSTQMAARDLRYAWFEELSKQNNFDYILTAHHLDDELETFLINLSRGSGLKGLSGIPSQNNKIIRPLLVFSREDILRYARINDLYWREDSSNKSSDYLRNDLRLNVIPKYKGATNKLLQNFKNSLSHLTESKNLLDDYLALISKLVITETAEGFRIDIQKLTALPNTRALLFGLLSEYGFTEWDDVYLLLEAQSGKQVFSKTHRLLKDRNVLLLVEISEKEAANFLVSEEIKKITEPIGLIFETVSKIKETSKHVIYLDNERLTYPLELRRWQKGDAFFPLGLRGKKKVSKFFKDEKLSLLAKEKVWLLCSDHKIVWVVGMRLDDCYKVTPKTTQILKIKYTP